MVKMVKFYASFATMRKAHSCFPPHILAHVTKYRLPTHACIAATTKDEQVRQIENVKQFRSLKNLQGRTKHTHPWPAVFGKLLCLLMRRKKKAQPGHHHPQPRGEQDPGRPGDRGACFPVPVTFSPLCPPSRFTGRWTQSDSSLHSFFTLVGKVEGTCKYVWGFLSRVYDASLLDVEELR